MDTVTAMFLSTQGFTAALEEVVALDVDDFEGWLVELWLVLDEGLLLLWLVDVVGVGV